MAPDFLPDPATEAALNQLAIDIKLVSPDTGGNNIPESWIDAPVFAVAIKHVILLNHIGDG
jgi:hypothetical protein